MDDLTTTPSASQLSQNLPPLSEKHARMLQDSAITTDVIGARGYRTVTKVDELIQLGFARGQCKVPGLLLPLHTTDGQLGMYVFRPDSPRVVEDRQKKNPDGTHPNRVLKYELPKGAGVRLDCPPVCQPKLANPRISLWVTEGQKKADSLASQGVCAVALLGVWNFKGKNGFGSATFLADWDYIALQGRDVRIVFDSDLSTKRPVQQALDRLREHLQRRGAIVSPVYLPDEPGTGKIGIDDWLAAGHTPQELEALINAPKPEPRPAPPIVELLDQLPEVMSRPLKIMNGRSYAATWLPVRITVAERVDKQGNIIRLNPPEVSTEVRHFIVRDDGLVFGEDGHQPLDDLGFDIYLPEKPSPDHKIWSPAGVRAFAQGSRPDPISMFRKLIDVVDQFIDFDRSLADQRTMAEFIACYILTTWFLDAFNVIGFLWPSGERGSGKTNLLLVVAELSYLGIVILAGGTYATLRDMADYGATLAFDDAENLADPKSSDPDKRALLLAGNRRGTTVPLKEPDGNRGWKTRHVNTYCPRLFSAIRVPDPVLASRSIIVPLTRTPDRQRANIDPADFDRWIHDRRTLIDDLWALAVSHLLDLKLYDEWVGKNASLTGRNLQPWRATLAIARWLDDSGETGLWERMDQLSVDYQQERQTIELSDFTLLIIRAITVCAINSINAKNAIAREKVEFVFSASEIADQAKLIAIDDEWDVDDKYLTSRAVGRALSRLRFEEMHRVAGKGPRKRRIPLRELNRLAVSYGLELSDQLTLKEESILEDQGHSVNGINGINGFNGTGSSATEMPPQLVSSPPDRPTTNAPDAGADKCYACGNVNWRYYPSGDGRYCATCHP